MALGLLAWAVAVAAAATAASAALITAPVPARRGSQEGAFAVVDDEFGTGEGLVRLKVLTNRVTGERLEVAWNLGGRTESLQLRSPTGRMREVLLSSRRNATDARKNVGWKGSMLIPYANRIKNGTYKLNGETFHLQTNEDRGVYGKNGLHGYLYSKEMKIVHTSADDHSAQITLAYGFDGQDPGYPFPLDVNLTYKLDNGGFTLTTRSRNRAPRGRPLPFYSSWHSYFMVTDISRAVLEFDKCPWWNHILVSNNSNFYGDLIPTGLAEQSKLFDGRNPIGGTTKAPTYFDDEFKAISPSEACPRLETRIKDPVAGESTVLWGDRQHRWMQVYTGTVKDCGVQAIAVEAMNGEADSWNNEEGIRLLQAGEVWEGSLGVYLEQLSPLRRPDLAAPGGKAFGSVATARENDGLV